MVYRLWRAYRVYRVYRNPKHFKTAVRSNSGLGQTLNTPTLRTTPYKTLRILIIVKGS